MQPFVYNARAARVIFGSGALSQLPAEVETLGFQRALVDAATIKMKKRQSGWKWIGGLTDAGRA